MARFVLFPLHVGALVGLSIVTGGCGSQDLYRDFGGKGNYRILSHELRPDCGAEAQVVPDARCIQVLRSVTGMRLQNCDREQEQLDLNVDLEQRGQDYVLTRVDTIKCFDSCLGGVTSGCTSNCSGGQSCDATALIYEATLDLDRQRLVLELTTHAQVQIPRKDTDACGRDFTLEAAMDAPCTRIDKFEAQWEGWNQPR